MVVARSCETIVSHFERQIRRGRLGGNEKLPTELQMCAMFGVSRPVVREAIRTLEAKGLVWTRRGSGTYVASETSVLPAQDLMVAISRQPRSVTELLELRAVVEAAAAGRAAKHASKISRAKLTEIAGNADRTAPPTDPQLFYRLDITFHECVLGASGNLLWAALVQVICNIERVLEIHLVAPDCIRRETAQHAAIAAAIENRDRVTAEKQMYQHLHSRSLEWPYLNQPASNGV
jgi:GntR family galactonate operon transcriptional repressor